MMTVVCLNPCLDKTIHLDTFVPGATNRVVSESVVAGGKGVNVCFDFSESAVILIQATAS